MTDVCLNTGVQGLTREPHKLLLHTHGGRKHYSMVPSDVLAGFSQVMKQQGQPDWRVPDTELKTLPACISVEQCVGLWSIQAVLAPLNLDISRSVSATCHMPPPPIMFGNDWFKGNGSALMGSSLPPPFHFPCLWERRERRTGRIIKESYFLFGNKTQPRLSKKKKSGGGGSCSFAFPPFSGVLLRLCLYAHWDICK